MHRNLRITFLLLAGILGTHSMAQTIHFGISLINPLPSYGTDTKEYYTSYVYFGDNTDLYLELTDVKAVMVPVAYLSWQSKNRFNFKVSVSPSRNVFVYDIDEYVDMGIRLFGLDVRTSAGYDLLPFQFVSVVPEIGIMTRTPLSIRHGTYDGVFSSQITVNSIPQISGVQAGILTNQTMDFSPLTVYGFAGLKIQWYNVFVAFHYDQNITDIDNRGFYKNSSTMNISFGLDLLSFQAIKNQAKK